MNQINTRIRFKPSQLINLKWFVVTSLIIGLNIIYAREYEVFIRSPVVPENTGQLLIKLPLYISLLFLLLTSYRIIKVWCISYEISSEEIRMDSGILSRRHDFIELYRVKDYAVDQPFLYRLFGLGYLTLYTSDRTDPVFILKVIHGPQQKCRIIRDLVERNRKAKHVFEVD
jgi:uncharacterized membrane protein YdbT with pleckstrin-like domain